MIDPKVKEAFERYGQMAELFMGLGMSMKDIAKKLNVSDAAVSFGLSRFFQKPAGTITLPSKLNDNNAFIKESWPTLTYNEIAEILNVTPWYIRYQGEKLGLGVKPQLNRVGKSAITGIYLDLETGIYYDSATEMGRAHNIIKVLICRYVKGLTKINRFIKA
jgi:hypothetical protein